MSDSRFDRDKVLHVAKLAALRLDDAEIDAMATQLGDIVAYVESLASIDVSDVDPTIQALAEPPHMREDAVVPSLSREEALAAAPASFDGGFAVPKVLEGDG